MSDEQRVPCPSCAELILPAAAVCRYCGRPTGSAAEPALAEPSGGRMLPWLLAAVGIAVVALVCVLIYQQAQRPGGSVLSPQSTQGATIEWLQSEAVPVMQTVSDEMTAVSAASASGNARKAASHLQAAGEALTAVSQSPDDGSLSSAMHLAGRRYVEASTAVAGGDWELATERIGQGNSVLANVNTRINN